MIKNLLRDVTLAVQAKSGVTPGLFIWLAVFVLTALTAFCFICVTAYAWLSREFGGVTGGLIEAAFFLVVAVVAMLIALASRRQAQQRAILERAAHGQSGSWLLDPKFMTGAVQVGRLMGWQRLVPLALLGFIAAQWAREYRQHTRHGE